MFCVFTRHTHRPWGQRPVPAHCSSVTGAPPATSGIRPRTSFCNLGIHGLPTGRFPRGGPATGNGVWGKPRTWPTWGRRAWRVPMWWAHLDLNQGPHPYQGCALTNLSYEPGNSFSPILTLLRSGRDRFWPGLLSPWVPPGPEAIRKAGSAGLAGDAGQLSFGDTGLDR